MASAAMLCMRAHVAYAIELLHIRARYAITHLPRRHYGTLLLCCYAAALLRQLLSAITHAASYVIDTITPHTLCCYDMPRHEIRY